MSSSLSHHLSPPFSAKSNLTIVIAESVLGERDENQDNYLLLTPNGQASYLENERVQGRLLQQWQKGRYRLAVADGMGGHKGGREVSEALIQKLLTFTPEKSPTALRTKLYAIHDELWNEFAQNGRKSPGTTLIMADVHENGDAIIANIGDSRAFLWRKGVWKKLTHDQSLNEYDWRDGEIKAEDYHPERKTHRLSQAMGYGSFGLIKDEYDFRALQLNKHLRLDLAEDLLANDKQQHADVFTLTLQKGDALLLASDGLWSSANNKHPLDFPKPSQLANRKDLIKFLYDIIDNGGTDNLTAVMLWDGQPLKQNTATSETVQP